MTLCNITLDKAFFAFFLFLFILFNDLPIYFSTNKNVDAFLISTRKHILWILIRSAPHSPTCFQGDVRTYLPDTTPPPLWSVNIMGRGYNITIIQFPRNLTSTIALTHWRRETSKRLAGKQCSRRTLHLNCLHCLQIVQPFFCLGVSISYNLTYLKSKMDSSNI